METGVLRKIDHEATERDQQSQAAETRHEEMMQASEVQGTEIEKLKKQIQDQQSQQQQMQQPIYPQLPNPNGDELQAPTFDPVDVDNMDVASIAKEYERREQIRNDYEKQSRQLEMQALRDEMATAQRKQEEQAQIERIVQFKDSKDDFDEYVEGIRQYYDQPLGIEDAYEMAKLKKAGGMEKLVESIKAEAPPPADTSGLRSPARASELTQKEPMPRTYNDAQSAALAAFDEVVGSDSETLNILEHPAV